MTHEWYSVWKQSIDIITYVILLGSAPPIGILYNIIENFSTILTKKFATFDRCIVTSLSRTSFENFDVEFNLNTLINFENEVENDDESIDIIDMIVLTIVDESVVKASSILLITKTLSIEIVVVVAYAVTQTIKKFLNQSFLCVNFDFLTTNDLTFSTCSKLTWKTFE